MGLIVQYKDEHKLRLVRSQSDATIFWNYEPLFFTEIDSHSSRNDLRRALVQAASWIRLQNRVAGTEECCVPLFYVNDDVPSKQIEWSGECFLVYEKDKKVRSTCYLLYYSQTNIPALDFLSSFAVYSSRKGSPVDLSPFKSPFSSALPPQTP